jgi:hypothetical protein
MQTWGFSQEPLSSPKARFQLVCSTLQAGHLMMPQPILKHGLMHRSVQKVSPLGNSNTKMYALTPYYQGHFSSSAIESPNLEVQYRREGNPGQVRPK